MIQFISQSKTNSKRKAIISLILGVVSIIPTILIGILGTVLYLTKAPSIIEIIPFSGSTIFILFFISIFSAITGIILGVQGLKSTKRKFAIAGIIFCLIGLLIPLYYFLK